MEESTSPWDHHSQCDPDGSTSSDESLSPWDN